MKRYSIGLAVVVVLVGVGQACGTVTVSGSSTQPSGDLLAYNANTADNHNSPVTWSTDGSGSRTGHWDGGACFQISEPNDVLLDKITVRIPGVYSAGHGGGLWSEEFHLEVWTASWPYYVGVSQVVQQTGYFPDTALDSGYWTFDLDDVLVSTGQNYLFLLGFENGPDSGKWFDMAVDWGGSDKQGTLGGAKRDGAGGWYSGTDYTPTFFVQGSVIPETSTLSLWGLLILCGIGIGWYRRRKA